MLLQLYTYMCSLETHLFCMLLFSLHVCKHTCMYRMIEEDYLCLFDLSIPGYFIIDTVHVWT